MGALVEIAVGTALGAFGCSTSKPEPEKEKVAMSGAVFLTAVEKALKSPDNEQFEPCDNYATPINDDQKLAALSHEIARAIVDDTRVPPGQPVATDVTPAGPLSESQKNYAIEQIAKLLSEGKKDPADGQVIQPPIVKKGVKLLDLLNRSIPAQARLIMGCWLKGVFPGLVKLNVNASDIEEIMRAAANQPAGESGGAIDPTLTLKAKPSLPSPLAGASFAIPTVEAYYADAADKALPENCVYQIGDQSLDVKMTELTKGPRLRLSQNGVEVVATPVKVSSLQASMAAAGTYEVKLQCPEVPEPLSLGNLTVGAARTPVPVPHRVEAPAGTETQVPVPAESRAELPHATVPQKPAEDEDGGSATAQ